LLTTQDTAHARIHQRGTREERALDLHRAQELATNSAARLEDSYPDAMLIFTYPFEFDPEVRAKISRHGDDLQEAVKEIHVGFGPVEDRRIGRRTRINVTMFQDRKSTRLNSSH